VEFRQDRRGNPVSFLGEGGIPSGEAEGNHREKMGIHCGELKYIQKVKIADNFITF
jgi:hypothetical protein